MLQRYTFDYRGDSCPSDGGPWVKWSDANIVILELQHEIEQLKTKLSALESSSNTLTEDEQKWWDILWAQYPRSHNYGKGEQPVPMSSKAATLKRYKINLKKHKVTPEQMVMAIAAYVKEQAARGSYIVALQTLLGDQKAYWVEYLQKGE